MTSFYKPNGQKYSITIPGGLNRGITGIILDIESQLRRRRVKDYLIRQLVEEMHYCYRVTSLLKELRKFMDVQIDGTMTEYPFPEVIK
jgi:hypothetical protein